MEYPKKLICLRLSKDELKALDSIKKEYGLENDIEAIRWAILMYASTI
jgi:hypothetical protein